MGRRRDGFSSPVAGKVVHVGAVSFPESFLFPVFL